MCTSKIFKTLMIAGALFCTAGVRADVININVMNATYTATCVGGGTCTEVVNGSFTGHTATTRLLSNTLTLSGTINASLNGFGAPPFCNQGSCAMPPLLFDSSPLSGHSPIEWNPTINIIPALTPTAFGSDSGLTIPHRLRRRHPELRRDRGPFPPARRRPTNWCRAPTPPSMRRSTNRVDRLPRR
jgi:hypothetical protein